MVKWSCGKLFTESVQYVEQWFPTTVPWNTSVPQAGPKCSATFFEILKFIQKSKFFGRKCSVRDFFGMKCSARNFPGLKCSATQKRLGTTDVESLRQDGQCNGNYHILVFVTMSLH
jgi:hypothetical protein